MMLEKTSCQRKAKTGDSDLGQAAGTGHAAGAKAVFAHLPTQKGLCLPRVTLQGDEAVGVAEAAGGIAARGHAA